MHNSTLIGTEKNVKREDLCCNVGSTVAVLYPMTYRRSQQIDTTFIFTLAFEIYCISLKHIKSDTYYF